MDHYEGEKVAWNSLYLPAAQVPKGPAFLQQLYMPIATSHGLPGGVKKQAAIPTEVCSTY